MTVRAARSFETPRSFEESFQAEGEQGLFDAVLQQFLHRDDDLFSQRSAGDRFENRIMVTNGPVGRNEIILVYGSSRNALRDMHFAATMKRHFRAFEDDHPVEGRRDLPAHAARPGIP